MKNSNLYIYDLKTKSKEPLYIRINLRIHQNIFNNNNLYGFDLHRIRILET
jgi:hypothetical protein